MAPKKRGRKRKTDEGYVLRYDDERRQDPLPPMLIPSASRMRFIFSDTRENSRQRGGRSVRTRYDVDSDALAPALNTQFPQVVTSSSANAGGSGFLDDIFSGGFWEDLGPEGVSDENLYEADDEADGNSRNYNNSDDEIELSKFTLEDYDDSDDSGCEDPAGDSDVGAASRSGGNTSTTKENDTRETGDLVSDDDVCFKLT